MRTFPALVRQSVREGAAPSRLRERARGTKDTAMDKIDFVQTWVDGGDVAWRKSRGDYEAQATDMSRTDADANAESRYRDNGLLKYWFRAVEKFTPWVNRIFLVTCGQKPGWLNEECPRLCFVEHRDYIPAEWLPTFHSNTIELNLHRLAGLSERFVLFNDDIFPVRPLPPEFFFRGGLPVVSCDLGIPSWLGNSNISRIAINNCGVLKHNFDVEGCVWRNWRKFFDVAALGPVRAAKNFASIAVNRTMIQGCFGHIALPHLKSTIEEIWRVRPDVMERTSRHRFRADDCVNHWLAAAWNLAAGRFYPGNERRMGAHLALSAENLGNVTAAIRGQAYPQICLSDKYAEADMETCFRAVGEAFEELLPEKSAFEK